MGQQAIKNQGLAVSLEAFFSKEKYLMRFPQDSSQRKIGTRARALVPSKLNPEHWEYHEQTGSDVGCDLIIELSENNEFKNKKIECQIKGTKSPKIINNGKSLSFDFPVITANYALTGYCPFVLFVVDTVKGIVYWESIKDYAEKRADFKNRVEKNKETVSVRIPITNILTLENDSYLCNLAKNGHL